MRPLGPTALHETAGASPSRAARLAVVAVAAMVGLTACAGHSPTQTGRTPVVVTQPTGTTPPQTTPTAAPPAQQPNTAQQPNADLTAAAAAAAVAVKGRAPSTGYDRTLFGTAWTDNNDNPFGHNGCDTRNDILRRDLDRPAVEAGTNGCLVESGVLHDPYTGTTIAFTRGTATSTRVQIDHVVALGDAWQTGAQHWSERTRWNFANDPLNLLAVDGPTNESKGDADAATWLPPNHSFRCRYIARQIAVKTKYQLWATPAEHASIARVLTSCPTTTLPHEPGRLHPAQPATTTTPPPPTAPAPTATHPPTTPAGGSCEPGYTPCLPVTTDLNCDDIDNTLKPIHVTGTDPYRLDSDHDGLGCEP